MFYNPRPRIESVVAVRQTERPFVYVILLFFPCHRERAVE
jgi:hypothetical protein